MKRFHRMRIARRNDQSQYYCPYCRRLNWICALNPCPRQR